MFGHLGVAAVGADQEFRADRDILARQPVAAGGGDAVGILHMADIFRRHARLRTARTGRLEEERLHIGLRQVVHAAGRGQEMFGARQRMVAPALHAADFFAGDRRAEDVLAHQVLFGREHIGLVLDVAAEIAQNLHRALVGDVGARRVGEPAVAVDDHGLEPVAREQGGGCRAGRPGADDQNVGGDVSHVALPLSFVQAIRPSRCGGPERVRCRCGR